VAVPAAAMPGQAQFAHAYLGTGQLVAALDWPIPARSRYPGPAYPEKSDG
jgi:hypothetical protein